MLSADSSFNTGGIPLGPSLPFIITGFTSPPLPSPLPGRVPYDGGTPASDVYDGGTPLGDAYAGGTPCMDPYAGGIPPDAIAGGILEALPGIIGDSC